MGSLCKLKLRNAIHLVIRTLDFIVPIKIAFILVPVLTETTSSVLFARSQPHHRGH